MSDTFNTNPHTPTYCQLLPQQNRIPPVNNGKRKADPMSGNKKRRKKRKGNYANPPTPTWWCSTCTVFVPNHLIDQHNASKKHRRVLELAAKGPAHLAKVNEGKAEETVNLEPTRSVRDILSDAMKRKHCIFEYFYPGNGGPPGPMPTFNCILCSSFEARACKVNEAQIRIHCQKSLHCKLLNTVAIVEQGRDSRIVWNDYMHRFRPSIEDQYWDCQVCLEYVSLNITLTEHIKSDKHKSMLLKLNLTSKPVETLSTANVQVQEHSIVTEQLPVKSNSEMPLNDQDLVYVSESGSCLICTYFTPSPRESLAEHLASGRHHGRIKMYDRLKDETVLIYTRRKIMARLINEAEKCPFNRCGWPKIESVEGQQFHCLTCEEVLKTPYDVVLHVNGECHQREITAIKILSSDATSQEEKRDKLRKIMQEADKVLFISKYLEESTDDLFNCTLCEEKIVLDDLYNHVKGPTHVCQVSIEMMLPLIRKGWFGLKNGFELFWKFMKIFEGLEYFNRGNIEYCEYEIRHCKLCDVPLNSLEESVIHIRSTGHRFLARETKKILISESESEILAKEEAKNVISEPKIVASEEEKNVILESEMLVKEMQNLISDSGSGIEAKEVKI